MKNLCVAAAAALIWGTALALPSIDAVKSELAKGNDAQAETMMQEVLAARPGSARAHYVEAQILARDGHFERATAEARRASELDPQRSFTDRASFDAFSQLLSRERDDASHVAAVVGAAARHHPAPAPAEAAVHDGLPVRAVPGWGWAVGLVLLGWLAWRALAARIAPAGRMPAVDSAEPWRGSTVAGPTGFGTAGPAGHPDAPGSSGAAGLPAPAAPGPLNGILGTGLAAAGGLAAGMLAEHWIQGRRATGTGPALGPGMAPEHPAVPVQWSDPQPLDDDAQELERRSIDFGSGDGWDNGPGDAAGAADLGCGGSDDGW